MLVARGWSRLRAVWVLFPLGVVGCGDDASGAAGSGAMAAGPHVTMIAVHNVSAHDYADLVVGEQEYGVLQAGERTDYRDYGTVVYRYNSVSLTIEGAQLAIHPIDYVGEEPLGSGHYSYEIDVPSLEERRLTIVAVRDPDP